MTDDKPIRIIRHSVIPESGSFEVRLTVEYPTEAKRSGLLCDLAG